MAGKGCVFVLAAVVAGAAAGCGPVIGWFVNAFAPPQKVKAVYQPPKGKKMLVLVDDIRNPVSYEPVKRELTERLNRQLEENKVAAQTVPYQSVLDLVTASTSFHELSVVDVGQKLGADLVLYVHVDRFSVKDDEASPLWQGRLEATVRMVDVQRGLAEKRPRLWPEDRDEGYVVEPVETQPESHPSENYGEQLAETMAEQMADRIAKLFYDHEVRAQEAARRPPEGL